MVFYSYHAFAWNSLILLGLYNTKGANSLPSGFIAEPVTSKKAVSGVFAKNPRNDWKPMLLLVNKSGKVRVLEDPDESSDTTDILDIEDKMCTNVERGLQSIAVHPEFEENRYIYLYYTKHKEDCLADDSDNSPWNVVSRFVMDPETLMLDYAQREDIWRGAPLHDAFHNGGAMIFGNDGKLYVTTGDGGTPENAQDQRNNLGNLLRLNDDGSTPNDNPFTTANGYESYHCRKSEGKVPNGTNDDAICSEIFATGLRNPFRLSMDPNEKQKTRLAISDVGGKVWEEIDYAGTDYEGVNYGHNQYEGPCFRHSDKECLVPKDFEEPFYWYQHRSKRDGCVAGSTFVPEGLWPEEYKFLFIDFVWYNIYTLIEDKENACRSCLPPIPEFRNETFFHSIWFPGDGKNEAKMVDMFFGPYKDTQALYVIKFGNHDTVLRIRYTGVHNEPPSVNFEYEDKFYDVTDEIQFDGSDSKDPEGDELIFKWYFGDGYKSGDQNPIHTYDKPGAYTVTLIVADSLNQLQQKSRTIQVGTPPTVNIISPSEGNQFYVGQVLRLKGEAFYVNGTAFHESQLEWEARKHHNDHYHPFLDSTFGNDFDLSAAPEPEDFHASLNSYLEIILRATDEDGLVSETSRLVQPTLVMVDVKSNIPGVTVFIENEPIALPEEVWAWKEQDIRLKAEDIPPFIFHSWSDGVLDPTRLATLNYSNPSFEAIFCVDNDGNCQVGTETCCIGECNADGKCSISVPVELPPLDATLHLHSRNSTSGPAATHAPTYGIQVTDYSNTNLGESGNSNQQSSPTMNKQASSTMSASGKAVLFILSLLVGGGVLFASFVYRRKFGDRSSRTNSPPTS
uniref:PKD domain-containing protein n=2 Tax=Pseudo-nitzschia australis TaxID=44445 RepID=A0A7S4AAF2_9STRA|mmetsp:Transcript_16389/g.34120  ORF Transcript_16389/g.34120 Transcript_16389/m.34120 type:complete len:847 (-) Transcript_16389:3165-5705(-)